MAIIGGLVTIKDGNEDLETIMAAGFSEAKGNGDP